MRYNVLSSVEIFDPQTNAVEKTLDLPVARRNIFSGTIGTLVVFVGGTYSPNLMPVDYNAVDVYDTESERMWTINLPDLAVNTRQPIIAGTKIYFFPRYARQLIALDIMTNETSQQPLVPADPDAASTNGTHVFFIKDSTMRTLDISTNTWTSYELNIPQTVGTVSLTTIGSTTVLVIRGRSLTQIDLRYEPARYTLTDLPERIFSHNLVGDRWYLLGANTISVYSPNSRLIEYRLGSRFVEGTSVIYNNMLYFSAKDILGPLTRFNLDALFKPVPIPYDAMNTIVENGYIFVLESQKLSVYNLKTQQAGERQHSQQIQSGIFNLRSYVVGKKLLLVFYPFYGIFDFETETWTTYQMPFNIFNRFPSGSGLDRYVIFTFTAADVTVYIFDIELNQWHWIQVNSGTQYIVQDKVVVIGSNSTIDVYDIPTQQWEQIINGKDYFLEDSMMHGETIIFQARSRESIFRVTTQLYNVVTGELRVAPSPSARLNRLNNYAVVGDYAIFFVSTFVDQWATLTGHALNIKSLEWAQFNLPPTAERGGPILIMPNENVVYVARKGRIDTIDMSTLTPGSVNVPLEAPEHIYPYGSKVLFISTLDSGSKSIVVFETSTSTWISLVLNNGHPQTVRLTQNYIVSQVYNSPHWMEFPAMLNTIGNEERFVGQSVEFAVDVVGSIFSTIWMFEGNRVLQGQENFALNLHNLTEQNSGTYAIHLSDICNNRMTQSARLTVHGAPSFAEQLTDSIILCDDSSRVYANASGKDMQIRWEIENQLLEITDRDYIDVSKEKLALECNSQNQLCAIASNPSGQDRSCTTVQIRARDSIFDGPRLVSPQMTYFTDSIVNLVVNVLHDDCTEHVWLLNGNKMDLTGLSNSTLSVKISQLVTANVYKVLAVCGNTELQSYAFSFDPSQVSSLTQAAVAFIVVGTFLLLAGAIMAGVLVRRQLLQSKQHEIELENLLNQAKSDSYKPKDGVSIIHTTSWEWSPGDEYTYRPIDNFPCDIDTSLLKYSSKNAVDIEVWVQGDIIFSPKDMSDAKDKKRERLLSGLGIDVYVPKSPKYEIKVEPASFSLQDNKQMRVTVSSTMRMTTKSNVCLIVVCEQHMIYSVIEFKIESKPSMWIDIEEIKMTGDFLGGGGYVKITRVKQVKSLSVILGSVQLHEVYIEDKTWPSKSCCYSTWSMTS
jgi:hypothetical protein